MPEVVYGGPSHPNHIHQYVLWSPELIACHYCEENDGRGLFWGINHGSQNAYVFYRI